MVKILLIRHGETEGNVKHYFQLPSTRLTSNGRLQAKLLGSRISEEYDISRVFSSPYVRAVDTAREVASKFQLPIIIEDSLKERHFGYLSGKHYSYIFEKKIDVFSRSVDFKIQFGESSSEFSNRCSKTVEFVLDKVKSAKDGETLVFVSHGLTLGQIISRLVKMAGINLKKRINFINTSVSSFNVNFSTNGTCNIEVNFINSASHLTKNGKEYFLEPKAHI